MIAGKVLADGQLLPRPGLLQQTWLVRLAALVGVIAAWQVLGIVARTQWIPPFSDVIERIADLVASGSILPSLATSLTTLAIGFTISSFLGIAIGALMALSRSVDQALRFYVEIGLFIPHIVFAPIFFAFFGLSDWTLIAVIIIYSIFQLIVTTQTAIMSTERSLREMARSFGATKLGVFREVTLRAAGPMIFAGLRLAMGRSVKGMVTGEIFVTVVGLGALERQFSSSFDGSGMWAIATIVIAVAIVFTSVIQFVDRRVNAWTSR